MPLALGPGATLALPWRAAGTCTWRARRHGSAPGSAVRHSRPADPDPRSTGAPPRQRADGRTADAAGRRPDATHASGATWRAETKNVRLYSVVETGEIRRDAGSPHPRAGRRRK